MARDRALPGFKDSAPADRYCDLVLTGGVTSAIAYPGVVFGLAQVYRFQSIGGSSSGAGSAALAAAAEYRRRHGSSEGFRVLLQRTTEVADCFQGKTGLSWLFQPSPGGRRLFKALVGSFAASDRNVWRFLRDLCVAYAETLFWASVAVWLLPVYVAYWTGGTGPWSPAWILVGVLAFLIAAVYSVLSALWHDLTLAADADYGLCTGMPSAGEAPHPPITPWLHELIQDIAGLPHDQPLTFADLRCAPGGPREAMGDRSAGVERSIDLRMYTSNITLGRPCVFPQDDDADPADDLYFCAQEMAQLFPETVVQAMCRAGQPLNMAGVRVCPPKRGNSAMAPTQFWRLPRQELPVIVAARMSVSFPVLFCAVPLWRLDQASRELQRMLFVDGGLCANFPIHLFDSPVPAWPTFGVALHTLGRPVKVDPKGAYRWVQVATTTDAPAPLLRQAFDQACTPRGRILGFAQAAVATMKDWNDTLQSELPGVRERLARIGLPPDVGGLNILMSPEQMEWLAEAGGAAARKLLKRYALPGEAAPQGRGWQEHRWVRLNVLAASLRDYVPGIARSAQSGRYAQPIREQIRAAVKQPPLAGGAVLQPAQAAQLEQVLDAILALERHLGPEALDPAVVLQPQPALRVRPQL